MITRGRGSRRAVGSARPGSRARRRPRRSPSGRGGPAGPARGPAADPTRDRRRAHGIGAVAAHPQQQIGQPRAARPASHRAAARVEERRQERQEDSATFGLRMLTTAPCASAARSWTAAPASGRPVPPLRRGPTPAGAVETEQVEPRRHTSPPRTRWPTTPAARTARRRPPRRGQSAEVHADDRGEADPAAVLHAAGHDEEHRGPRDTSRRTSRGRTARKSSRSARFHPFFESLIG